MGIPGPPCHVSFAVGLSSRDRTEACDKPSGSKAVIWYHVICKKHELENHVLQQKAMIKDHGLLILGGTKGEDSQHCCS